MDISAIVFIFLLIISGLVYKIINLKSDNSAAMGRIKFLEMQNAKYCNEKLLAQAKLRMIEGKEEVAA